MASSSRRGQLGSRRALARNLYQEMVTEGSPSAALVLADLLEESGYLAEAAEARRASRELEQHRQQPVWRSYVKSLTSLLGRPAQETARAPYIVSTTYEVFEEGDDGEIEEVERGFDEKDEPMTLRDVMKQIEKVGGWELDHNPFDPEDAARRRYIGVYSVDDDVDYRTGRRTTSQVHVHGTSRAILRLGNILKHESRGRWR